MDFPLDRREKVEGRKGFYVGVCFLPLLRYVWEGERAYEWRKKIQKKNKGVGWRMCRVTSLASILVEKELFWLICYEEESKDCCCPFVSAKERERERDGEGFELIYLSREKEKWAQDMKNEWPEMLVLCIPKTRINSKKIMKRTFSLSLPSSRKIKIRETTAREVALFTFDWFLGERLDALRFTYWENFIREYNWSTM